MPCLPPRQFKSHKPWAPRRSREVKTSLPISEYVDLPDGAVLDVGATGSWIITNMSVHVQAFSVGSSSLQEKLKLFALLERVHWHPNVAEPVAVLDYSEKENKMIVVTESVEGSTLFDYVMTLGDLMDEDIARSLFKQLAKVVTDLHSFDVFHVHLAPEAIKVVMKNGEPCVKLTEFRSAMHDGGRETDNKGELMESDVRDLGVCLFFILTGEFPSSHCQPLSRFHMLAGIGADCLEVLALMLYSRSISASEVLRHPWLQS